MSLQNLRLPDPLKVSGGNVADNWERFKDQWENYERAADLTDASAEKRAAVFLTCLGGEAYDTYRSLALPAGDKKDIAKLIEAFETFCIGSVNVTYQRYLFYQRVQEANERFDKFLGEVRRMGKSCQFESMEESMIRDRVVVGVKDDATRHKLLQVRDLTLRKASESAGQQLRAMAAQEHVQALQPSQTVRSRRSRPTASTPSKVSLNRCKYCGGTHEPRRELCPAYGQRCHRCSKKSHFGSVCLSTRPRSTRDLVAYCDCTFVNGTVRSFNHPINSSAFQHCVGLFNEFHFFIRPFGPSMRPRFQATIGPTICANSIQFNNTLLIIVYTEDIHVLNVVLNSNMLWRQKLNPKEHNVPLTGSPCYIKYQPINFKMKTKSKKAIN